MTSTKTIEALQEIRDAKRDQLDALAAREAMVAEDQIVTLDEWIHELANGRGFRQSVDVTTDDLENIGTWAMQLARQIRQEQAE
ncbi:MAG: hypothetical protein ABEL51_03650 [Salinibacter sp.]